MEDIGIMLRFSRSIRNVRFPSETRTGDQVEEIAEIDETIGTS